VLPRLIVGALWWRHPRVRNPFFDEFIQRLAGWNGVPRKSYRWPATAFPWRDFRRRNDGPGL